MMNQERMMVWHPACACLSMCMCLCVLVKVASRQKTGNQCHTLRVPPHEPITLPREEHSPQEVNFVARPIHVWSSGWGCPEDGLETDVTRTCHRNMGSSPIEWAVGCGWWIWSLCRARRVCILYAISRNKRRMAFKPNDGPVGACRVCDVLDFSVNFVTGWNVVSLK